MLCWLRACRKQPFSAWSAFYVDQHSPWHVLSLWRHQLCHSSFCWRALAERWWKARFPLGLVDRPSRGGFLEWWHLHTLTPRPTWRLCRPISDIMFEVDIGEDIPSKLDARQRYCLEMQSETGVAIQHSRLPPVHWEYPLAPPCRVAYP